MSDPHKRNIEKLLQAAGAKRLEQSGVPDMHPALRETLQTEVRRVYGATPRVGKQETRWFLRLLPKAAVFVALGACAWLLMFQQDAGKPQPLALNESLREATAPAEMRRTIANAQSRGSPESDVQPTIGQKPESRSIAAPAFESVSGMRDQVAQHDRVSDLPEPAPAAPRSVVGSDYFKADRQGMYLGMASTGVTDSAAPTDDSVAIAGLMKSTAEGVAAVTSAGNAGSAVLQNFTVLNEGSLVRLIDADGSTYEGQLLPLEIETARSSTSQSSPEPKAGGRPAASPAEEAGAAESGTLNFRLVASGANRSLGQTVQFTGNLELTKTQWSLGRNPFRNTLLSAPGQPDETQPVEPSRSRGGRLQGTAVLGDGQNVAVDATATTP